MAGASFDIRLDNEQLRSALDKLIWRAQNLKPVYAAIGEMLLVSHRDRWDRDKKQAPDGSSWATLSPGYKKSKRKRESKGADKILVLDTFLRDTSLSYSATHSGLKFGANSEYAATHQFGDSARNIPARPFLGMSDDDEQAVLDIISDWLSE
jgi:phage virion morphogenesis protein